MQGNRLLSRKSRCPPVKQHIAIDMFFTSKHVILLAMCFTLLLDISSLFVHHGAIIQERKNFMNINIESAINNEILQQSTGAIVRAIRVAYSAAEDLIQEHDFFKGRNEVIARGHARYFFVHASLWQAYERNELRGFTAKWETFANSLQRLLLETNTFLIETVHLTKYSSKPRSSITRKKALTSNQRIFSQWESLPMFKNSPDTKVHLFLVHGYRALESAHILCVDTLDKHQRYQYQSPNLLLTAVEDALVPAEKEKVFAPALKNDISKRVQKAIGA
jgi:hypothetical protein